MSKAPIPRPSETMAPVPAHHRRPPRKHAHAESDPQPLSHGSREAIVREDKEVAPRQPR